eukprot:5645679-Pleurochrysis_carterae.AAC.1
MSGEAGNFAPQETAPAPRLLLLSDNLPKYELVVRAAVVEVLVVNYEEWSLDDLCRSIHEHAAGRLFETIGIFDHAQPGKFGLLACVDSALASPDPPVRQQAWEDFEKFFHFLSRYIAKRSVDGGNGFGVQILDSAAASSKDGNAPADQDDSFVSQTTATRAEYLSLAALREWKDAVLSTSDSWGSFSNGERTTILDASFAVDGKGSFHKRMRTSASQPKSVLGLECVQEHEDLPSLPFDSMNLPNELCVSIEDLELLSTDSFSQNRYPPIKEESFEAAHDPNDMAFSSGAERSPPRSSRSSAVLEQPAVRRANSAPLREMSAPTANPQQNNGMLQSYLGNEQEPHAGADNSPAFSEQTRGSRMQSSDANAETQPRVSPSMDGGISQLDHALQRATVNSPQVGNLQSVSAEQILKSKTADMTQFWQQRLQATPQT